MKQIYLSLIAANRKVIYLILLFTCHINLFSQKTVILSSSDKFLDGAPTIVKPSLSKVQRLNSANRGTVICMYESDFSIPDSMKSSIEVAAQTWESYLNNKDSIYIKFTLENLDNDDIQTDVTYLVQDNMIYPYCLARHNKMISGTTREGFDAVIVINQNTKWDCGFSDKIISSSKNLTSAILRGIATDMGFGASIRERKGNIIDFYIPSKYSVFDNLVISDTNKRLSSMVNNPNLKNFVTSNLYALKIAATYQLYTPNPFEYYSSLRYFKEKGSLMSYGLHTGEKLQQVDSKTIEILKEMGWKPNEPTTIKIIAEGIPDTGITSAYESHYFYFENNTGYPVNEPHWTFELTFNNGEKTILAQSNSSTFTIPALSNTDQYKKNVEGDINGIITLTAVTNGKKVVQMYNLNLEVKPAIYYVSKPIYTYRSSDHAYFADFTVKYGGARYLTVGAEEDYVTGYDVQDIFEPYQTHVRVGPFGDHHDAWVDLTVENQYGKTTQTVELYKLKKISIPGSNTTNLTDFNVKLYDMNGTLVKEYYKSDKVESLYLPKGFYIQKYYNKEECIKTEKIVL